MPKALSHVRISMVEWHSHGLGKVLTLQRPAVPTADCSALTSGMAKKFVRKVS